MSKQKLNDPILPVELDPIEWDKPELVKETIENKEVSFVMGANAKLGISVFNSEGDNDESGVFGKAPDALIPFDAVNAWLKYAASCNIKVKGGLDIKSVGFEMNMEAGLEAYVYRKHNATEFLEDARTGDLASIKTIFSKDQIKSLAIDEAVGLEFAGKLGASVSLTWSDVWSTQLSMLSSLLDTNELIKIKVLPEASIKTSVELQDAFRVQIVKKEAKKYRLVIKRNQSKKWTTSLSLDATIKIENPEVITNQLDSLFEQVFLISFEKVEKIVEKKENALSEAEKLIIKTLADRLGWKGNALQLLKDKVETLYEELHDKVEAAVKTKAEAGFKYEYLRMSEREDLFSAGLSEDGLDYFHLDILRANCSPLISYVEEQQPSAFLSDVKFLRKDVSKRERTSGFSLGIGNWAVTNKNVVSLTQTTRKTERGIQVSYEGRRSYEDGVGKSKSKWYIDFNAEMPKISNQPSIPLASEFDYSLFLHYEWNEKKFKPSDLESLLDLCRLWNVISEGQWDTLHHQLEAELTNATTITFACQATYPHDLFRVLITAMGNATPQLDEAFYLSLGAALPYWAEYPIRTDIERKAAYYAPVWKEFLQTESDFPQEIAAQRLKKSDKALAESERNYKPNEVINFRSFAYIANSNPQTLKRWKAFRQGVQSLSHAIDHKALQTHDPVINKSFQNMEDLWRFPHHVKAFGNYLVRIAEQYPQLQGQAVYTAEVRFTKKDKEQVLLIGRT